MADYTLDTEIKYLKGVGENRDKILGSELQLTSVFDLIYYFPFRHVDRSKLFRIADIPHTDALIQFKGKITEFKETQLTNRTLLTAIVADDSGTIEIVWFAAHSWVKRSYRTNVEYLFFGKPN
ncbi:MAG: ATP-dependent DNA helicase RecG, partial [Salinivirgaceae bacterium]|nr:ATP-dependent DNA helicase RecG [Salinivirgaceae bacterium]